MSSQSKGNMSNRNLERVSSRGVLTNKSGVKSPAMSKSPNNRSQKRLPQNINPATINSNQNIIETQVNTVLNTAQNKLKDLDNEVEMLEQ